VVPAMSVRRAAYANSVFVIAPDQDGQTLRAHQRFVTLGQTVGEDVIVFQGLKPGERVAGAGSFKLREGVKIISGPPGGSGGSAGTTPPSKEDAAPGG
jgi:multidrug efflux pump subunit AcrA (membrane-fusion protein)